MSAPPDHLTELRRAIVAIQILEDGGPPPVAPPHVGGYRTAAPRPPPPPQAPWWKRALEGLVDVALEMVAGRRGGGEGR